MRITYENTIEDLVAFQHHYLRTSKAIKRQLAIWRWGGSAAVFVLTALVFFSLFKPGPSAGKLAWSAIGAGVYWLFCPWDFKRRADKLARKLYAQDQNKTVLGSHELELHDDAFIERTPYNENRSAWGAIENIESTEGHTFIYVGTAQAHIIPHAKITEGDLNAFLADLGRKYRPHATLATTGSSPSLLE